MSFVTADGANFTLLFWNSPVLEFRKLDKMAAPVQQKHDCEANVEISFENVKKVKISDT